MKKILLLIFCLLFYSLAFAGLKGGFYDPDTDLSNIPKNLVPLADDTYDIGSSAKKWQDLYLSGDITVNGDDITCDGDLTITPSGDDVLLDSGLTVGSTTQAGDNNLRVEGTSALVGNVTVTGDIAVNGGDITSSAALNIKPTGDTDDYLTLSTVSHIPTIYGTGAYTRIGDASATAKSLDSEDDLLVTGELECASNLYSGTIEFPTDAGAVQALDMALPTSAVDGTEQSISVGTGGNATIRVYSESNGSGGFDTHGAVIDGFFALKPSATQSIATGSTILNNAGKVKVVGNSGTVYCVSDPTITAGKYDGQLIIIQGTSNTNTVTIEDEATNAGSTLELAGGVNMTLGLGDIWTGSWDSSTSKYYEVDRSDN